jgi:hypothetical protein
MDGHSKCELALAKVLWSDAELESVQIDYDAVVFNVRETTGHLRLLRAEGHVRFCFDGFWDEIVIDRVEVIRSEPDPTLSIRSRYSGDLPASGNVARNTGVWLTVVMYLIDGVRLEVTAGRIVVQ